MMLKVPRFINLILAALLAGNKFGTWVAVHPALCPPRHTYWQSRNSCAAMEK
jgi:hypothetical protein